MTQINPNAVVQVLDIDSDALKFQLPMSMSISGPSQSGILCFDKMIILKE